MRKSHEKKRLHFASRASLLMRLEAPVFEQAKRLVSFSFRNAQTCQHEVLLLLLQLWHGLLVQSPRVGPPFDRSSISNGKRESGLPDEHFTVKERRCVPLHAGEQRMEQVLGVRRLSAGMLNAHQDERGMNLKSLICQACAEIGSLVSLLPRCFQVIPFIGTPAQAQQRL